MNSVEQMQSGENKESEKKPYESVCTSEQMTEEMIEEAERQGYHPEDISFSTGFNKSDDTSGESVRFPFFIMNFRDGKEQLKAYWNPETKGATMEIEYSGEAVVEEEN